MHTHRQTYIYSCIHTHTHTLTQNTHTTRDRRQAIQQRFSSLQVSGNMWEDLAVMREGVHIETTSMARKRLLMNYEWYPQLLDRLPPPVKVHPYCKRLLLILSELANHMRDVGPGRMSRRRLIQVLATLRPWELRSPGVSDAVEVSTIRKRTFFRMLKCTPTHMYSHPHTFRYSF